jgi:hypothetical protein
VKQEEVEDGTYIEQEPEVMVKVEVEDDVTVKEQPEPLTREYLLEHTG